ncbi:MAG TPA: hypothetical protein VI636_06520 [Candidatus Angelobacter sp.]
MSTNSTDVQEYSVVKHPPEIKVPTPLWLKLRAYYGLIRPYNFRVAIPCLLNVCVLTAVVCVCVFLFFGKSLSIGTARFYFYCYIAVLLLVAAALSKARVLSYMILSWCLIELGLAFSSALYPRDIVKRTNPDDLAFIYHPLLQLVPRPNYHYTTHLNFRNVEEKAKAGGIDVAALQGLEIAFDHNSLGLRGKELTPDDLSKDLIFVYGGSTTYDSSVTQGETWTEHLQSDLDNQYTVLNFGVVAHSTEEHVIETAFYQDVVPKRPVCAIYYEGWNDVINVHLDNLDGAYANYHVLTTAVRRPDISLASYSPLLLFLNDMVKNRFDTVPKVPKIVGRAPVNGSDPRLEAVYIEHLKTLAGINNSRGIKTIFIGQIINKDYPQGPNVWAPLIKKGGFPPLIERFNSIMKDTAASMPGTKYIDAGNQDFQHSDFVDYAHFTIVGARKFASHIANQVGSFCK